LVCGGILFSIVKKKSQTFISLMIWLFR
jgi:hypothetical protein